MATQTLGQRTARAQRPSSLTTQRSDAAGWGLVTPFIVLYLAFLIIPTIYGLVMSFFDTSLVKPGLSGFLGVHNYVENLTSSDFWASIWHTVLFTIMSTPPLVIVALLLALLADRLRRGRWFFRLVFFAPYVVPSAVAAMIFTWLYAPGIGLYGTWLQDVGITPPNWLADPNWAMASVVLMTVWWTLGFNFVLYLAGLQDIPRELYEAASVDGASPFTQMFRITVPLLSRTTALVVVLQILASLKIFDQIYLMTAGGPNYSTRPLLEYVYDLGFTDFRVGYTAAASMLYMLLIVLVSVGWVLVMRRQNKEV